MAYYHIYKADLTTCSPGREIGFTFPYKYAVVILVKTEVARCRRYRGDDEDTIVVRFGEERIRSGYVGRVIIPPSWARRDIPTPTLTLDLETVDEYYRRDGDSDYQYNGKSLARKMDRMRMEEEAEARGSASSSYRRPSASASRFAAYSAPDSGRRRRPSVSSPALVSEPSSPNSRHSRGQEEADPYFWHPIGDQEVVDDYLIGNRRHPTTATIRAGTAPPAPWWPIRESYTVRDFVELRRAGPRQRGDVPLCDLWRDWEKRCSKQTFDREYFETVLLRGYHLSKRPMPTADGPDGWFFGYPYYQRADAYCDVEEAE